MSDQHLPLSYRPEGEPRVITPADVCDTCSDFERGFLVPVSFCPTARQRSDEYYAWLNGAGEQPAWLDGPDAVRGALGRLDGSSASAVSLLTGVPVDQLDEYGGMP